MKRHKETKYTICRLALGNARVRVFSFKSGSYKTSLVVQWLRLFASTAGNMDFFPSWETKIPHASWCSQKKIQQKRKISLSRHPAGAERMSFRKIGGESGVNSNLKRSLQFPLLSQDCLHLLSWFSAHQPPFWLLTLVPKSSWEPCWMVTRKAYSPESV